MMFLKPWEEYLPRRRSDDSVTWRWVEGAGWSSGSSPWLRAILAGYTLRQKVIPKLQPVLSSFSMTLQ